LFSELDLELPVISANMDTITGYTMAHNMFTNGGIGCLHRFMSIEENVHEFNRIPLGSLSLVSIGITEEEKERAKALHKNGAGYFCIDVAHGASKKTAEFYNWFKSTFPNPNVKVIVGNFATAESIHEFNEHVHVNVGYPDAYKVGIGGGSMCTTRIVTGCGIPTLSSVLDCVSTGFPIIADGGIRNSGDICKALAAGAIAVMLGGMLAGTDETPGELVDGETGLRLTGFDPGSLPKSVCKKYRGSASKESYTAQGKDATHRTAEGESTLVQWKGPVSDVLAQIEAGIRSSMAYVGAKTLTEFRERAKFIQVSQNSVREGQPHGKINR
jgi:IMP dehydrogenase